MPPTSRAQQKLVFARARAGEAWAKRWIAEGNMKVQPRASAKTGTTSARKRLASAMAHKHHKRRRRRRS